MKRRLFYLPFVLLVFLNHTAFPSETKYETGWTEKKLGKAIIKADKAAQKKNWAQAIQYGQQMLKGSDALDQHIDARYINLLKNLNRYYDKSNRLAEVSDHVIEAYTLSRTHLGLTHETTMISRTLYYKLLISNKHYQKAIPVVLENLSISSKDHYENYRRLHYLKQLYSLYGLTGQLEKEEKTLLQYMELNRRIFDYSDEGNSKIILNLANNYCRQKKFEQFNKLTKAHNLKYIC